MEKLKVLLCSPMNESGVGGITKWTQYIVDYASAHNEKVILKQYYPPTTYTLDYNSVFFRVWRGLRSYLPLLKGLKKQLRREKYDVVHFSTSASLSLLRDILAIRIAHSCGIKAVTHFHFGRIPKIFKTRNWEYRLMKRLIRMVDMAVVMDVASYETLKKEGYKNIALVPNPLSSIITEIIKSNEAVKRDLRKVVFVGHAENTKGVHELISACKEIENIKLELYGAISAEMHECLIEEAGKDNSQWLEIKGEHEVENVIKAMLSAGVFSLPTYTEGFPNVILESMACACPIVTTPVGAIPEMLDINGNDKCGICVPPQDANALKEAILFMLDNKEYASQCGEKARKRVNEQYSMDIVWNKLLEVWKLCSQAKLEGERQGRLSILCNVNP